MILVLQILACISAFSIMVMLWLIHHATVEEEETDFASDFPLRYLNLDASQFRRLS